MQTRGVRLSLLALLLIAGLGAGLYTWDIQQRFDQSLAAERDVEARFDRLARNILAFGAAQQASVVPGHTQSDALARGATLLKQIDDDVAELRSRSRSTASVTAFSSFADALESAVKFDARAREHLRIGQELMAADLVLSDGRASIDTLTGHVSDLQGTERTAAVEERRPLKNRAAMVVGGVILFWVLGLFALARVPAESRQAVLASDEAREKRDAAGRVTLDLRSSDAPARNSSEIRQQSPVDLAEAASVCTALSRVATAAEIPGVLERAADVLDSSGLIVWLGAGEELFAATSHGYPARVLARLGPIRRDAANATAAAWRACTLRVVQGDPTNNGAVVAPLFGPSTSLGPWSDGCIGVLTAEIRGGRENDHATQAVTAMFAAQLSTVIAAWPAPSAVEGPAPSVLEGEQESTAREVPSEAADGDPNAATA